MSLPVFVLTMLQAATPAPGTYAVVFCASPCAVSDSGTALATGILVLDSALLHDEPWFGPPPNGCFKLRRAEALKSYAVLFPHAYMAWESVGSGDSIAFDTYRSPDAGHNVRAVLTAVGFEGLGHSWGAGAAAIEVPDEYVAGTRLGPPDRSRCTIAPRANRMRWLAPLAFTAGAAGLLVLVLRASR